MRLYKHFTPEVEIVIDGCASGRIGERIIPTHLGDVVCSFHNSFPCNQKGYIEAARMSAYINAFNLVTTYLNKKAFTTDKDNFMAEHDAVIDSLGVPVEYRHTLQDAFEYLLLDLHRFAHARVEGVLAEQDGTVPAENYRVTAHTDDVDEITVRVPNSLVESIPHSHHRSVRKILKHQGIEGIIEFAKMN